MLPGDGGDSGFVGEGVGGVELGQEFGVEVAGAGKVASGGFIGGEGAESFFGFGSKVY